jgi:hypothetical protein
MSSRAYGFSEATCPSVSSTSCLTLFTAGNGKASRLLGNEIEWRTGTATFTALSFPAASSR